MSKNCKKITGKKFVEFRGKCVYYTNMNDLTKKLKISPMQAKKLINTPSKRLVEDVNNNIEMIDIKKNNTGLLKKQDMNVEDVIHNVLSQWLNADVINVILQFKRQIELEERQSLMDKYYPSSYGIYGSVKTVYCIPVMFSSKKKFHKFTCCGSFVFIDKTSQGYYYKTNEHGFEKSKTCPKCAFLYWSNRPSHISTYGRRGRASYNLGDVMCPSNMCIEYKSDWFYSI